MLEELLNEIEELKEYKEKYEHAEKDKERLSEYVYKNELEKWKNKTYAFRVIEYQESTCNSCRFYDGCDIKEHLPEDIGKPTENKGWFPGKKTCGNFEWS